MNLKNRGEGMAKGDLEFCSEQHNKSGRFIEACLLLLLKEESSYGYNLMERLSEFNFLENSVNISMIYRNLRSMEKRTLVKSSWIEGDQGPKKRIYELTSQGEIELEKWMDVLKFRKTQLQLIIEKHEKVEKGGL